LLLEAAELTRFYEENLDRNVLFHFGLTTIYLFFLLIIIKTTLVIATPMMPPIHRIVNIRYPKEDLSITIVG